MREFNCNNKMEHKTTVDLLLNEIFQLSCSHSKSNSVLIKSCDKCEKDIFYLDCARFQLEIILINLGISVQKFYEYKYEATGPNDDDYRSFSYSFRALITLWKNFCGEEIEVSEFDREFNEKSFNLFLENLKRCIDILNNNIPRLDKNIYILDVDNIAL